jgi:ferredoxin
LWVEKFGGIEMVKKRLILDFPKELTEKPITYKLIKDYGIEVTILRAKITPDEEGRMMVEVKAKEEDLREAVEFLEKLNIKITPLAQDIIFREDRCTHCTYCVSLCPVGAFVVLENMEIKFEKEKCVLCENCVKMCPYKAVEIEF